MRKIISLFITMILTMATVSAQNINKTLSSLGINKSAVSVSVKDVKSGEVIYELNERTPRLPASTLKLVTSSASLYFLGDDYNYKTSMYKSTNNDLYIKLSGDPLLVSSDLGKMFETAREKGIAPKSLYIDDSVFDTVEWGDGWQWDDELNPLMQRFSVYNINKNLVKVEVIPTVQNSPAKITVKPFYPMSFVNNVKSDAKALNNLKIRRDETITQNMFSVEGAVSRPVIMSIPVLNPKVNFNLRVEDAINSKKFEYFDSIKTAVLPKENVYYVDGVTHSILDLMPLILKSSSNLVAETLFKTAGASWANSQGSTNNSVAMLNDYFEKIGLKCDDIKVVDGSGVSKNNLMTSDFMTNFLVYKANEDSFDSFKEMLPAPGEGTLKNRMLYFKENLRAKTGTLSDASAIAGYITTKRGKTYCFDIMINDPKTSDSDKKNMEEQILRSIFLNY